MSGGGVLVKGKRAGEQLQTWLSLSPCQPQLCPAQSPPGQMWPLSISSPASPGDPQPLSPLCHWVLLLSWLQLQDTAEYPIPGSGSCMVPQLTWFGMEMPTPHCSIRLWQRCQWCWSCMAFARASGALTILLMPTPLSPRCCGDVRCGCCWWPCAWPRGWAMPSHVLE